MKTVVVTLAGAAGSGTAILGARVASLLNWPFASFGSYVRGEAAHRGLQGTRRELQDVGSDLLDNTEAFCRAVIAQSRWRPGQSLVVDGLRHREVLDTLTRLLRADDIFEVYVAADMPTRELRLRERGEVLVGGPTTIDIHPVEKEVLTILPAAAQLTINGQLPEENQVDLLVEALIQLAHIPPNHSWITPEHSIRIPASVRQKLLMKIGDRLEFEVFDQFFCAFKIVDEDKIRSVFGRLRTELANIEPTEWIAAIRGRIAQTDE